jgi:hypothetical protein
MRTQTAFLLSCMLLLLAAAPWLISSCTQQPLLPDELRQARTQYEERVEAAQAATMEAQRQGDSIRTVITLGTVAVTPEAESPTPATVAVTPSPVLVPLATTPVTPTMTAPQPESTATKGAGSSSVTIIRTTVLTPTVAANLATTETGTITATGTITSLVTTRVVVRSNTTPAAPTSAPVSGGSAPGTMGRPPGLVTSVDVITEEMLTAQIEQEARDLTISALTVRLAPDGFHAFGEVALALGFSRPVEVHGIFMVENDSLVAKVSSILLNGLDVTEQYGSELERRVNWGLYQLLPERYVDSFELGAGQVTVQSEVRP